MTTAGHLRQPASRGTRNRAGELSVVLGAAGITALLWAWLPTTSIDPPSWVQAPGLMLLPVGALGSVSAGAVGLLTPPRRLAAVGLALGCLTLVGLLVLELRYGS